MEQLKKVNALIVNRGRRCVLRPKHPFDCLLSTGGKGKRFLPLLVAGKEKDVVFIFRARDKMLTTITTIPIVKLP